MSWIDSRLSGQGHRTLELTSGREAGDPYRKDGLTDTQIVAHARLRAFLTYGLDKLRISDNGPITSTTHLPESELGIPPSQTARGGPWRGVREDGALGEVCRAIFLDENN